MCKQMFASTKNDTTILIRKELDDWGIVFPNTLYIYYGMVIWTLSMFSWNTAFDAAIIGCDSRMKAFDVHKTNDDAQHCTVVI